MAGDATTNEGSVKIQHNVASIGLNMDQSVNQIAKGSLTYALNAAVENFDDNSISYQNEPGNELCVSFPEGYVLIGKHFIQEQNKHIFFLLNKEEGKSEIGYMENNNCIYVPYISADCLNFNINHPIHKVVHKITNCFTEIYWTDGINPRRYLNLSEPPYKVKPNTDVCDREFTNEIDCNKLSVQPNFTIPQIDVVDVVNIGNLTAGTYQFAIQYCDVAGDAYTSYYSITNPTPIANKNVITPDFNYNVGKSIVLNISNIDTTGYFKYFNVAVIKTVNAITSVELIGTYFIDTSVKEITYSGQNVTQIRLTIDDVFEKFPYYEIAQDLTTAQDILIWDNLTSIDRINYQKIANQIDLKWQTYRLPSDEDYSNEIYATNLRGYLRDEVYAFEIVFLLDNGKQTDGFHIPGRSLFPAETTLPDISETNPDFIGTPDYIDPVTGIGYSPYWKIYNTATVIGPASGSNIGKATPYQYGEFAYWESTDIYPCNEDVWGELSNQPIRHHKFPDVLVSPIFESPTYSVTGNINPVMQNDAVFPIGVKVDVQQVALLIETSTLSREQKDQIVGFKIVRGDRNTNSSIIAKGILRNVGKYERDGTSYYFPNYPYNDLREDPFLLDKNNGFINECFTYVLVASANSEYTYTDCYSNTQVTKTINNGETIRQCSLTAPTSPGSVTITRVTTVFQYQLSCISGVCVFTLYSAPGVISGIELLSPGETVIVDSGDTPTSDCAGCVSSITQISEGGGSVECRPNNLNAFSTDSSKYRHVFNSPETSFGQPFLGSVLKMENVIFGGGEAHFVQVRDNAKYKLLTKEAQEDALDASKQLAEITGTFNASAMFAAYQSYLTIYVNGITRKNYAYSYNSRLSYDYSAAIQNNGFKQREIDKCQYLFPGVQSVGDDLNINNWNRESSVYIKTVDSRKSTPISPLPYPNKVPSLLISGVFPAITDESRFIASSVPSDTGGLTSICSEPEKLFKIKGVSYYGSLKNVFPNQWGQIYSYNTIDTGYQELIDNPSPTSNVVFGGDTFISRFAFKTKLPFFIDNRVGAPDDSDIFYDEIGNVAYPKYWHSARSVLSNYRYTVGSTTEYLTNIISYKAHNFDCPNNQLPAPNPTATPPVVNPNRTFYDGKFYLFAYGIPNFYCESSVNVDLRQAFNNREGDFWPRVSSGIPDDWFQERFVSIANDNTYYYNVTFSKQNKENFFSHLPLDWREQLCFTNFPFRAIYSDTQQSFTDNRINNWLIYRPISSFDFPQNYGDLISLDGIQNKAVLARFENKSLLYNTMLTINTSNPQAAYIGNDTLFKAAPPIDFAETDLGYVGSQNKMLLKIPQGQVTVDAKRGQIFVISGNQATDLCASGSGMNRFFTDHLAFEILRHFPDVNTDNHFNGIGLHGVYDSKFDRVIITKLDYIPVNKDVKYDAALQEFYIEETYEDIVTRKTVRLTDREYFCNKSWSLSYNFVTRSWISFHSYIPNWYIAENNFFYSGTNDCCVDFEAIVAVPVEETTTTTTTTLTPTTTTTTTLEPTTTTTTSSTTTTTTTTIYQCDCHQGFVSTTDYYTYQSCDGAVVEGFGNYGTIICYNIYSPAFGISDIGESPLCLCPGETTSTTTSTTTLAPECEFYYNNTQSVLNGINYTDCNGEVFVAQSIGVGDGFCAQIGTVTGGDFGLLIITGYC